MGFVCLMMGDGELALGAFEKGAGRKGGGGGCYLFGGRWCGGICVGRGGVGRGVGEIGGLEVMLHMSAGVQEGHVDLWPRKTESLHMSLYSMLRS